MQETHFDSDKYILDLENNCNLYHTFTQVNSTKQRGIAILLKKNLDNLKIENFHYHEERIMSVQISLGNRTFNLVNIYSPNTCSEQIQFIELLSIVIHNKKKIILGGDFNFYESQE